MKKNFTLFLLSITLSFYAQIPAGYYNAAIGKSDATLRVTLKTIISSELSVTSYAGLYTAYATTDKNPENGKLWDMYSNCNFTIGTDENHGANGGECTNYNREHTTPQSWFGGDAPMYSDLFNVYPTDSYVNGKRSNYPYGEVASISYTSGNGSKLGTSGFAGYSGTVFEPIDEYKGDFARTYMYMATCYAGLCESWTSTSEAAAIYSSSNLGFTSYAVALYLKWSRQDPVSTKEINRNNAVYSIQHNRNPFIDHPELAEFIWGTRMGEQWSLTTELNNVKINFSISPNPVQNELSINSEEQQMHFVVYNLSGQLMLAGQLNISKTIQVSQLNNGMYLLQLSSGNKKSFQKFVVNK
ncbi:MAG: endonuclease [Paludibacter sp.]|nr:endonuclease [Paludibacter sp.]